MRVSVGGGKAIQNGGRGIDLWKEIIMAADSDGKRNSLKGTEALNGNRWKEKDVGIQRYSFPPQATNSYCYK
jgi:hypothetical protein